MFRPLLLASAAALALAACSDTSDDVVQQPAPGAAPEPVSEARADTAQVQAALAFGMTRDELEDADLIGADNTDLGDVETLVLDPTGAVSHVVVELNGPNSPKVSVPIAQVRGLARNDGADKDLATDLTAAQLAAMPAWTPPAS